MAVEAALAVGIPTGSATLTGLPAWFVGRQNALATAARWDGGTWRSVTTPWTTDTGLTAVSALSASAAWSVGFGRLSAPKAISARWNGSSWQAVLVPHAGGRMATLTDVVALTPQRALAVGLRLAGGRLQPLALFRTKSGRWLNRSPSFGPDAEGGLTAVSRASNGTLWAVGWRSVAGRPQPWIGWWDGTAWNSTPTGQVGAGLAYLTDVEFRSATEGWAVGYLERDGGRYAPIFQRWNGVDWQPETMPWEPDASVVLTTVALDSSGDVAVAGQLMSDEGGSAMMAINQAGAWQQSAPRNDPYPGSWSQDASGLSDGVFVVGQFGPANRAFISCEGGTTGHAPTGRPHSPSPSANGDFVEDIDSPRPSRGASTDYTPATLLDGFEARDMTTAAGLTMQTMTYSGVVADFNADTWPDVFINRHGADVPYLALGGEGGFTQAAATFQFTDRHLCAAADATGGGVLDLFCTVGRRQGTAMGAHEFLVDVGETGGTLAADQFGVLDITGRGRAAAFVQLASDLLPSLFVANEPVRIDGQPSFNRFYRNLGGTGFVPAPELGLDGSSGGLCALAAELDGDPDDELLVCTSEVAGGVGAGAHLYDFDGTQFVDRTIELGIAPFASLDLEVADFNGDSLPDIAQLRATRLRVSLGTPDGFVKVFELEAKMAVAMAIGDVNDDGRPDIYVSRQAAGNGAHLMLVNGGDGRSFTNIEIPQVGSGSADDVLALDYDQNGLSDFVTFNGIYGPGPIKLTAFFRTGE